MARQEIEFQEASVSDAQAFLDFMKTVAVETEFLVMDETGLAFSEEEMQTILQRSRDSLDQLVLLAKLGTEVIGAVTIRTPKPYRISHIGNLFLAVKKAYWQHGIATILLEETLEWARQNRVLGRLELTVQVRNEPAVHLYQKMGFTIEGTQKRGARTDEGEWLDLYYMGQLIDET